MYCHSCGTRMPEGSLYCANCGEKLLEGRKDLDIQSRGSNPRYNPKQIFFQKLAGILTNDGFKIDPRLLEKSDAGNSVKEQIKELTPIASYILGPIAGLVGSFVSPLYTWTAVGGEDLYLAMEPVASLFNLIVAKYKQGSPVMVTAIDADNFDYSRTDVLANALCNAFVKKKKINTNIVINCLYIFFDEKRCARASSEILKKGKNHKRLSWTSESTVYVWPVILNVPGKKIEYKNNFLDVLAIMSLGWYSFDGPWVVSRSKLYEALIT